MDNDELFAEIKRRRQDPEFMDRLELPVDWFDSPEPPDIVTNNDLDPTPCDPDDYAPFWDTAREWIEPHPDMEGYRCSSGWLHVAYPKSPVPPMLDNADYD